MNLHTDVETHLKGVITHSLYLPSVVNRKDFEGQLGYLSHATDSSSIVLNFSANRKFMFFKGFVICDMRKCGEYVPCHGVE